MRAPCRRSVGRCTSDVSADAVTERAERPWSDDEDRSLRLWIALARAYATVSREVSTKIGEYGLTTAQFGVLEALHHLGPLPLGELADKLLVTGGNVTYVMDRLEARGLASRCRSEQDRRVISAALTPAGRDLMVEVFPGHATFIAGLTSTLSPAEQDDARRLLKALGRGIAGDDAAPADAEAQPD